MINNFKQISNLLVFNSEDEFYFVQIIQRKKDNPDTHGRNNKNRTIRSYRITSVEQLYDYEEEMIKIAVLFNARVGINLNKRSFEKTAFNTLEKIAGQMKNRDYRSVKSAYDSSCGIHNAVTDKLWILDVDNVDTMPLDLPVFIANSDPAGEKIITVIPSRTGIHIITKPFNLQLFPGKFPYIEVHKNNPTNLYIP